jgi:hypothetical protein
MGSLLAVGRSACVAARPIGGSSMRSALAPGGRVRCRRVAAAIGGGCATGAPPRGSRRVGATGRVTGRKLADPRAGLVWRRARVGCGRPRRACDPQELADRKRVSARACIPHCWMPRRTQELAYYKRVPVRGRWRRTGDECMSARRPQVCAGRTAVNDRGRGVSRRRSRASIAHNSRGQKE